MLLPNFLKLKNKPPDNFILNILNLDNLFTLLLDVSLPAFFNHFTWEGPLKTFSNSGNPCRDPSWHECEH